MSQSFAGQVLSKTINAEGQGHSHVRVQGTFTTEGEAPPAAVEVMISSVDASFIDSFQRGQAVEFTLE